MNLLLHGATAQPQTLAQATVFDTVTGLKQNVVQMFWSMQQGNLADGSPRYTSFPIAFATALWQKGQLYLHTWGTWDWVNKVNWTSADICAGRYDTYFRAQAKLLAAWKHPLFVRLNHEFNGTWSSWFTDGPSFVALWRHIVDLFRAEGATNITWVWCPNALAPKGSTATTASDKVAAYYPGDAYVDWTAFDAYNVGGLGKTWVPFTDLVSSSPLVATWIGDTYGTIAALAPTKPMMLAEFGCNPVGGDKSLWLKDALAVIPVKFPLIRAINYYNVEMGGNAWPLLTTDGTAAAWAAGIKAGPYAQNFPMPPDGIPIKPLSAQWGDPTAELRAQLALLDKANATLSAQNTGLADDLALANVGLTQAHAQLVSADALHTVDAASIARLGQEVFDAQVATSTAYQKLNVVQAHIRGLLDAAAPQL